MTNSLWAETALPSFPPLDGDCTVDVLVVGGGLAGLLCAHALTEAGAGCLLIEANRICGGVTANTTAKLTAQHGLIYGRLLKEFGPDTTRLYWLANEAALERYRKLAKVIPCEFTEKPSYVYSLDRRDKLLTELAALEQTGIRAVFQETLPLPFPVAGAIRFDRQAQFHPLQFAAGIARGLRICEHTEAQRFAPGEVVTNHGRIRAKHIVIATHFPILNKHGGYFLKLYQHRSYVLALEGGPELEGMYVDEAENGLSLRNHGKLLLLGGGDHRTGKHGGGWAEVETVARQLWPGAEIRYRWATQDCMSLDGVPYIGPYGQHADGLWVATGFNKWGMTSSMAAAMVLSDRIQGRRSPYEAVFSPSRTMLRPQFFRNAWEAASNLLTLSKPRCPHMGCALKWNPREHSWDCPCHGSRFAEDGRLLEGPATGRTHGIPRA